MTQREAAGIGRRILACAIDVMIPAVLFGAVAFAMIQTGTGQVRLVLGVAAVLWLILHSALQGGEGSIGMRVLGIRLIGADDLRPIGFGRALARNTVFVLLCAVIIGFFTPLFDRNSRQGWHDRIAVAMMVQQSRRTPVLPPVLQEEKRAGEWLAGVSEERRDTEPITDVPVSRMSRYLTTEPPERSGAVIETVPGVTDDRVRAERARVRNARRARGEQLSALGPVQAGKDGRARAADAPPSITRPPAPPLTITQRSARSARPAIVVSPPARGVRNTGANPSALTDAEPGSTGAQPGTVDVRVESADAHSASADAHAVSNDAQPASAGVESLTSDAQSTPADARSPLDPASEGELSGPSGAEAATAQRLEAASMVLTIMWDDGTLCEVERATVFGRNPTGGSDDGLAVVFDDSLSLSKSHFRVLHDGTTIGLVDLHSTNGVRVRREGVTTPVVPGEFTPLQTGDLLEIGSRRARVEVL